MKPGPGLHQDAQLVADDTVARRSFRAIVWKSCNACAAVGAGWAGKD